MHEVTRYCLENPKTFGSSPTNQQTGNNDAKLNYIEFGVGHNNKNEEACKKIHVKKAWVMTTVKEKGHVVKSDFPDIGLLFPQDRYHVYWNENEQQFLNPDVYAPIQMPIM